jgi:hypothetical protein
MNKRTYHHNGGLLRGTRKWVKRRTESGRAERQGKTAFPAWLLQGTLLHSDDRTLSAFTTLS